MHREIRDLGTIPAHIKTLVGWEALAWHTPEWWRFQWEITELVEVTTARAQPTGWSDWLLWSNAVHERDRKARPDLPLKSAGPNQGTIDMLKADRGDLLTFALLVANKIRRHDEA